LDSEAAKRALDLAQRLQGAASFARPAKSATVDDPNALLDAIVTEPELRDVVRQLFVNGHYSQAVGEGFKYLNNLVKRRTGSTADGASLMTAAFSVSAPLLRLPKALKTESQKNQQQGYMLIFQGSMIGVRNPRAHEHEYLDDPRNALELLALCNHLVRVTSNATRTRVKRKNT
jgi:uncharacterized protein (TIGR02391 family)